MKRIFSIILLLTITLTLAACSGKHNIADKPLSIGILPDVDSIPLVMAEQNRFFKSEGLNIKLERFKSAMDRDSALQSGRIDGAVSDILAAAFALNGGFKVKITSMTNGSYKLLASKTSGIKDTRGIQGKSIAISKNTIIEYSTDAMLNKAGVKLTSPNKTIIPQIPVRLEMLQNGKVDAATLPEPLASVAINNGAKILDSSDNLNINPGVLLFTSKAATAKSAEIKAFYKAYNRAVEYLGKENLKSFIPVLIKQVGFPEAVKETLELPKYNKAVLPSRKDFNDVIKWLWGKSLIKSTYKYNDLVDDTFVRQA